MYLQVLCWLLLLSYLTGSFNLKFDRDEWQTMVAAADMANGALLYRDVWDNHGPLLTVLLSWILPLLNTADQAILMTSGRLVTFAIFLPTLWFTHRLARYSGLNTGPSLIAVIVLLSSQTLFEHGLEIRADVPLLLLWTLCLTLLFHGLLHQRRSSFFLAGIALGLGFFCSLKSLLLGLACGAAIFCEMFRSRRLYISWLMVFGAGAAISTALLILSLHLQGNLDAFLASYIGQNVDRIPEAWYIGLQKAWDGEELFLLLLTIALVASWLRRRDQDMPAPVLIHAVICLLLFVLYLRLPTHHAQSLLPLLPSAAIVISWWIGSLPARINFLNTSFSSALTCLILVLISSIDHGWFKKAPYNDLQTARIRQEVLPGDAFLFDGIGIPLFQPRPFIYKSYVHTICDRIRHGTLELNIPEGLADKDVPYIGLDPRIISMGAEVESFIKMNYIPLRQGSLLAAGKVFSPLDSMATWNVDIAGHYFIVHDAPDSPVYIDGREVKDQVYLSDGNHTIKWTGTSLITLTLAPPELLMEQSALTLWQSRQLSAYLP